MSECGYCLMIEPFKLGVEMMMLCVEYKIFKFFEKIAIKSLTQNECEKKFHSFQCAKISLDPKSYRF